MAELSTAAMTLAEHAKRFGPDGKYDAAIVELLSQTNEINDDMLWREGSLPNGDQATIRVGLPISFYRLTNQGTPTSTSKTAQITEQIAMLSSRSQVDKKVADMNGNSAALRSDEGIAHMESQGQQFTETLFYGSASNPEEIVGFSNRYNSTTAGNGQNVILGGGAGADNSSIWLIGWGGRSIHGIFPRGAKTGLSHESLGLQDAFDADNNRFRAYMDEYGQDFGLMIRDWRYAVRICNLDISVIIGDPTGATVNILELMLRAVHRLPTTNGASTDRGVVGVTPAFYCNRTIAEMLDIQAMNKSNLLLKVGNEEGNQKLSLRGIPIKTVDALTEAEDLVA